MKKPIPPVIFLICVLLMLALSYLLPGMKVLSYPVNLLGVIFMVAGLAMGIWVVFMFRQVKTEIHPFKTPEKLVTNGLFNYSRNPIYLGLTIILVGVWLLLGNLSAGIGVIVFVLIINFYNIAFEEKQMEAAFGKDYLAYKRRTRRWI